MDRVATTGEVNATNQTCADPASIPSGPVGIIPKKVLTSLGVY